MFVEHQKGIKAWENIHATFEDFTKSFAEKTYQSSYLEYVNKLSSSVSRHRKMVNENKIENMRTAIVT